MMTSIPADEAKGMDLAALQGCIEACSAAAMAATMCADSDRGPDMARCSSLCANTADVATTTMRMMMRPAGYDMTGLRAMTTACIEVGRVCSAECAMHADMDEHCRVCAQACDAMVAACEKALASMHDAG